ncbi:BRCA1-associated RING domain protein 1 isoform X1 [Lycium ferocissimum]|uniref:BRCA1-associated RING domain protein 1 isoform X1 n=1 Tax=Lycium ferocissimum TaxID=112874 RepID=UPI0028169CB4|nr:BRCA1-associated RING domain protein 1 isoform X1 [Lycium ferocissimum]
MAVETQNIARLLNPLAFHIQKLGLELKCPLCLNLLTKPTLLPCDHIFCNFCVPRSTQVQCECPVCKHQYVDQEIRAVPHMESMIAIFRSLDATFNAKVFQLQSPDAGRSLEQSPVSVNADDKSRNERSVKAIVSSNDPNKEINRHNGHGMPWNVVNHLSHFPSSDMKADFKSAEEIDLNQLQQQSPGSSHSSDNNKEIVKEISELRVRNTDIKSHTAKRPVEGSSDVVPFLKKEDSSDVVEERDVKRQKKLNYGLPEMALQSYDHNHQREIIANSDRNLICKWSESSFVAHPKEVSDQHLLEGSVCAFCHKSKITEGTGPMLHYANGREVVGDATSLLKPLPVHMKCIDWAPQVYYDGEIIKNLEAELARASKLKCSGCGLKGAALGCLVKSCRRSYHLPCAYEIQDCRWDCDNFVMLCPSHKSVKFPSEKSKSKKRASVEACPEPAPITSERLNFWATSSNGPKEWVLCGSALSSEEKYMLVKFANMCGATVCKSWNPSVTHVIAATDEKGACTRTLKVLMAILRGKWILTIDWIKASIQENCHVNEEPYEVSLDNHGCFGGPKAGRLRASSSAPKLFDGIKFYLSGDYVPAYKDDLLDLIEKAGGSIIHTKEQLICQTGATQATNSACLVVYNSDPPRSCAFGEESNILLQRKAKAEELAKQISCQVIQHTWILESIATCKLVPFC